MRKLMFALALVGALVPSLCNAQVKIDMGRVTCEQYLAMSPDDSSDFSAWMSGWFNQKNGYTFIDLGAFRRNVENVKQWCKSHKSKSVMTGLQAATTKK